MKWMVASWPGLKGRPRMLLYGIAAIRGRPFKPGQEATIHFIGYAALFTLIILITVNELGGLLGG
jgi:regulator of sigma E protease